MDSETDKRYQAESSAPHDCAKTSSITIRRFGDGELIDVEICDGCRADYGDDDLSGALNV